MMREKLWGVRYVELDQQEKEQIQKLFFWWYVDDATEEAGDLGEWVSVTDNYQRDWALLEEQEEYERCQLYQDTWNRFETYFKDFG